MNFNDFVALIFVAALLSYCAMVLVKGILGLFYHQ